jgi:hypothetical protein
MSKDYEKIDAELDDELRAMYNPDADDSQARHDTSPDQGTEVTPHDSDASPDEGTLVNEQETNETENEPTVPESRYKNAVKAMNQAQQELAQYRKYETDKDAYIAQLEQQLTTLQTTQPSTQPGAVDDDDLADARENFPELINPLLKKIDQLEKRLASVSDDVGTVKNVTNRYQQTEQDTEAERHFAAIRAQHDDLDEIVESPDYAHWYHQQGPMIQQALQQGTAKDVIAALNLYRNDHPRSTSAAHKVNGNSKLEAARNAASPNIKTASKPNTKRSFTMKEVEAMSPAEYAQNEDLIDKLMASGELY